MPVATFLYPEEQWASSQSHISIMVSYYRKLISITILMYILLKICIHFYLLFLEPGAQIMISMNYQMYIWYFNDILYFLTDAYFFQHRYRFNIDLPTYYK